MPDTYQALTVEIPEALAEAVEDVLHEAGALGLEVRDREAPMMPGVRGPCPGESIVIGFFEEPLAAREAHARLAEAFPAARLLLEERPQEDWSNAWKALIRSVEVGRLWVGPPWQAQRAPAGRVPIVIEPKMAFGTGDHPTTSLCLAALDAFLSERPGASVLDVGTGTGILAIAARKLGAGRVVGIDNDPLSVTLARENAALNGAEGVELSGRTLEDVSGMFDLVLANILANTLVELAPAITGKVSRRVVLAGVLAPQREEVEAAYRAQGLAPLAGARSGEWVRLDLERGAPG